MRAITEKQKSLFDQLENSEPSFPSQQNQDERAGKLDELMKKALSCSRCALRGGCRQVVFGEGNPKARLVLVGEGPGGDEDRLGRPFIGRAGQLLDRILAAASLDREEVYITNVVKCRPPANRLPLQSEVDSCRPYLERQLELIEPEIVVCLGALAARTLIDRKAMVTRIRGRWHEKENYHIMATFHPAALLRDPNKKAPVWEDFKQVMKNYHSERGG